MSRVVKNKMSSSPARRALRMSPLVWLLALGACTSVLGIEDLHEGPRDGETGGTDNPTAGKNSSAGKTNNNPGGDDTGGTTGSGGKSNGGGGKTNNGGTGNVPGDAGMGNVAADGGAPEGGAPNPGGSTVKGQVIDFWGHGVPNIPIQIGDVLGSTDGNGNFEFTDVPAKYDVSLVFSHNNRNQTDAWAYLGLTRRDPTLQIYEGADEQTGYLDLNLLPKPTFAADQRLKVGFGGKDGSETFENVFESGDQDTYTTWFGPDATTESVHGLLWQYDAKDMPTSYLKYDTGMVALGDTKGSVTLNLTKAGKPDSGLIAGTVTSTGAGSRSNMVNVVFSGGATIDVINDDAGPNTFSYLVPNIAGSSVTIGAMRGSPYEGWAVAHADGLVAGAKPTLAIPALPLLQTPASGKTNVVPESTKFTWQSTSTGASVVEFYSQIPDGDDSPYTPIYVVTAEKQLTKIPTIIGGGFSMYAGMKYLWVVSVHGNYPTVDAMADKGGFLDEYTRAEEKPEGPHRVSSTFAQSTSNSFTTAP